ncbi:MAG TPA: TetR/AcrR family transcriptional regulator [Rhodanobacteraceae bacterium]|nr:TetR/AcrR family transcriptional regulator [Rhodanobacteraceae bacterium]
MRDNPQFSTRQRILGAAEELFAERGFAAASLRQVTAAAKVNLAAVNYHFGSKNNLIEEVFRRRLDELSRRRLERLAELAKSRAMTLETLLDAFITPALELSLDREGGSVFMRVLARAFAEHNSNLRKFLSDNYGYVLKDFAAAFAQLLPQLDKEELYWRLDIAVGALTYAMADFGMIQRRSGESERAHREQMARHLIRFTAAGLRA